MIFSSFKINKNENIYIQIENQIKDAINKGILPRGSKLPSTREASSILNISRNSVVTAYENLESDGVIESIRGRGTFVLSEFKLQTEEFSVDWENKTNDYAKVCEELDILKKGYQYKKGMISFKSIAPEEKLFDIEEFKRSFLDVISIEGDKILNYGYARGYKPFIEYLMDYMTKKGINTNGKQILITNGFTEAFDITLSSLTNKNDVIVCEEPTHNTALKIMRAHGLKPIGVDMDEDGINTQKLENALRKHSPKFVYIIPSYHNPTGIVLKGDKRREIYNICSKAKIPIIEDGFNEELLYSSSHIAPIASLCTRGNAVIYIGSLSKILFPGLRIGWILADDRLIEILESVKRSKTIHSSVLDQAILCNYMKNGAFNRYLKKARKYYKDKYEFTLEQIKKYIPYDSITGEGGLHIFVNLKKGIDANEVLKATYKKGVLFTTGDIFFNNQNGKSTMRIGFARVSEEDIKKGIKIIGDTIKDIGKC